MTYYDATAAPAPPRPRLKGDMTADLVVIGGGCTGLSAALFARQRGYRVALLEAGRIGDGASGRNGGQIIPGLRKGPMELARRYGLEQAKSLFALSVSARDLVTDLIERHGIACDLALTGHVQTAIAAGDLDHFQREAEFAAAEMNYPHLSYLDRGALTYELASGHYRGGLLDRRGGHFHPLNYTLGLAEAAHEAGASLHEDSRVINLTYNNNIVATTATGSITAPFGIVACDALLGRLNPHLAGRIMPIASHIATTVPLPADRLPIRRNRAISDSYFAVNYFRMTADNRLVFGGGERYFPGKTNKIEDIVRKPMEVIFPQLRGIKFNHAWSGLVSITTSRLPDIGRLGPLFYAQGYSGQGVLLSSLAGKLLTDAMAGTAEQFDVMSGIAPSAFPGGSHLRTPLHVLGMLWYALRDRLG